MNEIILQEYWCCRFCSNKNWGLEGEDEGLRCKGCGSQRENEPWIPPEDDETAPIVTDPVLIARANAGEVWTCGSCRHSERAEHGECSVCDAPRAGKSYYEREATQHASSLPPLTATTPPSPDPELGPFLPPPVHRSWGAYGALFLGALGLVCFFGWFFGTHTAVAQVTGVSWRRTADIEERHIKSDEDWEDDLHAGAFDLSCHSKFKRNRDCDPYSCNERRVSYECNCTGGDRYKCGSHRSCRSNNNGSRSCRDVADYCTRPRRCGTCYRKVHDTCYHHCPVYGDWCSYRYPAWEVVQHQETVGADSKPVWPELHADTAEQRLVRHETFEVKLQYTDHTWVVKPESLAEFQQFFLGGTHKVSYSRSGFFKLLD